MWYNPVHSLAHDHTNNKPILEMVLWATNESNGVAPANLRTSLLVLERLSVSLRPLLLLL